MHASITADPRLGGEFVIGLAARGGIDIDTVLTDPMGAARHLDADPACAVSAVQANSEPAFLVALQGGPDSIEVAARVQALDYTKGVVRSITLWRNRARTNLLSGK